MNESDFAALSEHLQEVRPIFDGFCSRNAFSYVNQRSLGRYPRIRIERLGEVTIWFDLLMGLDKCGRRFEQFRPDLPYDLGAGADVVVQDGTRYGVRFQKIIPCFIGRAFHDVAAVLQGTMEDHLRVLERWDARYLREKGERIQLGGGSRRHP